MAIATYFGSFAMQVQQPDSGTASVPEIWSPIFTKARQGATFDVWPLRAEGKGTAASP